MYTIVIADGVDDQIAALPAGLLDDYADVVDEISKGPWDGKSINPDNPGAAVRQRTFGPLGVGHLTYLVHDRDRKAEILKIMWFELPE